MPTLNPYTGPDLFAMAGAAGNAVGTQRGTTSNGWDAAAEGVRGFASSLMPQLKEQQQARKNQHFLDLVKQRHPEIEQDPDYGILEGIAQTGGDMAKGIEWFNTYKAKKQQTDTADANKDADRALKAHLGEGGLQIRQDALTSRNAWEGMRFDQRGQQFDRRQGERERHDAETENQSSLNFDARMRFHDDQVGNADRSFDQRERFHADQMTTAAARGKTEQDAELASATEHHKNVDSIYKRLNAAYRAASAAQRKRIDSGLAPDPQLEQQIRQLRQDRNRASGDLDEAGKEMELLSGSAVRSHVRAVPSKPLLTDAPKSAPALHELSEDEIARLLERNP